jgi:hypothetical protein
MATTSVPDVLINLRDRLAARPVLVGPPVVPVYLVDLGNFSNAEAVVLSRVTMAGASFVGWGAGEASLATVEPLTLSGYLFTAVPGNDQAKADAALRRGGVLLAEVMQQLRTDPTVGGALGTLVPPQRWQPPLMTSAAWSTWMAGPDGTSVARVLIDFTIAWSAMT